MVDHWMDSWLYMVSAATSMKPPHDHLLTKDPFRLGWRCQVDGCRFFKPAHEFDGVSAWTMTA